MGDIYLVEFEKLKDEQISRAVHRDRLFHLTMVLFGGGITIALTNDANGVLLLLPVIAFIAGTSHIACDRRISSIGSYIKNTLSKRIAEKESVPQKEVFEWENFIDTDRLRKGRKRTQFLSNIFLYVLSGLGAIGWYVCWKIFGKNPTGFLPIEDVAVGCDLLLMGMMAWQLTAHAYIHKSKEMDNGGGGKKRAHTALKVVLALVVAAAAAAATLQFGAGFVAEPGHTYAIGSFLQLTRIAIAASAAFLLTACIALLIGRR